MHAALRYETLHSAHGSYNRFGHRLLEERRGFSLNYLPVVYLFKSSYLRSGHRLSIFINFAVVTKMERNDHSRSPEHQGMEKQ